MTNLIEITDPELLAGEELSGHDFPVKNSKHWFWRAIDFIKLKLSKK